MPRVFVFGALMRSAEGRSQGRAALVRDHEVRFVARGIPFFEPAFAALVPAEKKIAHGVVYDLSAEEWARLRAREAGYLETEVTAEIGEQKFEVVALAISDEERLPQPLSPSRRYCEILLCGAREHGLPREWIEELETLERSGPKLTAYVAPLMRMIGALIPYFGPNGAIAIVVSGALGAVVLAGFLLLRLLG